MLESPSGVEARERQAILELAETLGSVAEACRRSGISRTLFYRHRRRFAESGLDGLVDRRPGPRIERGQVPDPQIARALDLSSDHPEWGCDRLRVELGREGIRVGAPTIQRLLALHGMARQEDRWRMLEMQLGQEGRAPTAEQLEFLRRFNFHWLEYPHPFTIPGELLVQDVVHLPWTRAGKLYLHVVIEPVGGYVFARVDNKQIHPATSILAAEIVLPTYRRDGLPVRAISTGAGVGFRHGSLAEFARLLRTMGSEVRASMALGHGFVKQLRRELRERYVGKEWRSREDLGEVAGLLEGWVAERNRRCQPMYPNFGRSPTEVLKRHLPSLETASLENS